MMWRRAPLFALIAAPCVLAPPLVAATPRQILTEAAFQARDKATALAQIAEARTSAAALLAADAGNRDAAFVQAMALGYRAKLTRSRRDAMDARKQFEQLVASNPRDADAVAAVGTWHLDSVLDLGGMLAGMAVGAKKATGLTMMDRAVALGGNRAMFPGLAALLRLSIDPTDPRGRALAERASAAAVVIPVDRIFQRSAAAILLSIKAGDEDATQKLARQLLPFGRLER
jgi:hypothetical protein